MPKNRQGSASTQPSKKMRIAVLSSPSDTDEDDKRVRDRLEAARRNTARNSRPQAVVVSETAPKKSRGEGSCAWQSEEGAADSSSDSDDEPAIAAAKAVRKKVLEDVKRKANVAQRALDAANPVILTRWLNKSRDSERRANERADHEKTAKNAAVAVSEAFREQLRVCTSKFEDIKGRLVSKIAQAVGLKEQIATLRNDSAASRGNETREINDLKATCDAVRKQLSAKDVELSAKDVEIKRRGMVMEAQRFNHEKLSGEIQRMVQVANAQTAEIANRGREIARQREHITSMQLVRDRNESGEVFRGGGDAFSSSSSRLVNSSRCVLDPEVPQLQAQLSALRFHCKQLEEDMNVLRKK